MCTVRAGSLVLGDGNPKICVPITGRTEEEILAQAEQTAEAKPDLVEWRADLFEGAGDPSKVRSMFVGISKILQEEPLLFTYRSRQEGGEGEASDEAYAGILRDAANCREPVLIDMEIRHAEIDAAELAAELQHHGKIVIASAHDFSRTFSEQELDVLLKDLCSSGADMLKIAMMPRTAEDVLRLLTWTEKSVRKLDRPLITMSMGDLGKISRISGELTGSAVTFATVCGASALGQIPIGKLRAILAQLR